MPKLVLLIASLLALYIAITRIKQMPVANRRSAYIQLAFIVAAGVAILLAATGKMHWIGALLTGLLVLVRQTLPLLIQLAPSVDREEDGGALACHRTFWRIDPGVSEAGPLARTHATISELIFVPPAVKDGVWRLHLSVAPIASDAAPCRPLVWPMDARP